MENYFFRWEKYTRHNRFDFIVIILDSIHKRLTEKTLEMIRKERQGEQIESRIIKKVIHSYVEIGQAVNVSQLKSEKKLKNYDERFLEAFLVDTGLFYAAESSHYINTHSISDYLKKGRLHYILLLLKL